MCAGSPIGPGWASGEGREEGGGELEAEAPHFLLIEKCRSKNGSRGSKPRGGEEGGKTYKKYLLKSN